MTTPHNGQNIEGIPSLAKLRTILERHEQSARDAELAASAFRTLADDNQSEVRVTSVTGGQKGAKLARYDLMPVDALRELAEHYGKGEKKYPAEAGIPNFRKGYDISLSYAALQRHANQFWGGEDIDAETGSNHMIAAAWHALYIVQTMHDYGDRFDDRLTTSRRKLEED